MVSGDEVVDKRPTGVRTRSTQVSKRSLGDVTASLDKHRVTHLLGDERRAKARNQVHRHMKSHNHDTVAAANASKFQCLIN